MKCPHCKENTETPCLCTVFSFDKATMRQLAREHYAAGWRVIPKPPGETWYQKLIRLELIRREMGKHLQLCRKLDEYAGGYDKSTAIVERRMLYIRLAILAVRARRDPVTNLPDLPQIIAEVDEEYECGLYNERREFDRARFQESWNASGRATEVRTKKPQRRKNGGGA